MDDVIRAGDVVDVVGPGGVVLSAARVVRSVWPWLATASGRPAVLLAGADGGPDEIAVTDACRVVTTGV